MVPLLLCLALDPRVYPPNASQRMIVLILKYCQQSGLAILKVFALNNSGRNKPKSLVRSGWYLAFAIGAQRAPSLGVWRRTAGGQTFGRCTTVIAQFGVATEVWPLASRAPISDQA